MKRWFSLLLSLSIWGAGLGWAEEAPQTPMKKVLFLNSYHQGYPSSDEIMKGADDVFSRRFLNVEYYFLNTIKYPDEELIRLQVDQVLKKIQEYKPDIILASDDNAVKYVIAPHFKNGSIPVVFCGVNWTAQPYGLPTEWVTGMVEVLPVSACIQTLRKTYPEIKNLTILMEDTPADRNLEAILEPLFKDIGVKASYAWVDNFEDWKTEFQKANETADVIFVPTYGSIQGWDESQAVAFVKETIKKPVFTCDDFMMKYAVFGLTKVAREQGQWAAKTVSDILYGQKPSEIPVAQNKQTQGYVNITLANQIGMKIDPEWMQEYTVIE